MAALRPVQRAIAAEEGDDIRGWRSSSSSPRKRPLHAADEGGPNARPPPPRFAGNHSQPPLHRPPQEEPPRGRPNDVGRARQRGSSFDASHPGGQSSYYGPQKRIQNGPPARPPVPYGERHLQQPRGQPQQLQRMSGQPQPQLQQQGGPPQHSHQMNNHGAMNGRGSNNRQQHPWDRQGSNGPPSPPLSQRQERSRTNAGEVRPPPPPPPPGHERMNGNRGHGRVPERRWDQPTPPDNERKPWSRSMNENQIGRPVPVNSTGRTDFRGRQAPRLESPNNGGGRPTSGMQPSFDMDLPSARESMRQRPHQNTGGTHLANHGRQNNQSPNNVGYRPNIPLPAPPPRNDVPSDNMGRPQVDVGRVRSGWQENNKQQVRPLNISVPGAPPPGTPSPMSTPRSDAGRHSSDSGSMPSPSPRSPRFLFDRRISSGQQQGEYPGAERRGSNNGQPSAGQPPGRSLSRSGPPRDGPPERRNSINGSSWRKSNDGCSVPGSVFRDSSQEPPDRSSSSGSEEHGGGWEKDDTCTIPGSVYRDPKRPRMCGQQGASLSGRWEPSHPAKSRDGDSSKKGSFAGRFVPRGGVATELYKKHVVAKASGNALADSAGDKDASNNATNKSGIEKASANEAAGAAHTENGDTGKALPQLAAAKDAETMSVSEGKSEEVAIVMKLPPSLEKSQTSLKDIVKDTYTPELTDASTETDLRASSSYSSCSVPHARVTPSTTDMVGSPHSLMHPEDVHLDASSKVASFDGSVVAAVKESSSSKTTALPEEATAFASEEKAEPVVVTKETVKRSTSTEEKVVEKAALQEPPASSIEAESKDAVVEEASGVKDTAVKETSESIAESAKNVSAATAEEPWVTQAVQNDSSDSSDEETDEEELMLWAQKMFGITPHPIAVPKSQPEPASVDVHASESASLESSDEEDSESETEWINTGSSSRPKLVLHLKLTSAKKKSKRSPAKKSTKTAKRKKAVSPRRQAACKKAKVGKGKTTKAAQKKERQAQACEAEALEAEEAKRKKDEAKPLTAADVRRILAEDPDGAPASTHWVRRSVRQPSRSILHSPHVRSLLDKLRVNDYDMIVLKMKKYLSSPDTPPMLIDAALDALEENTNCQALYIQNFNEGMRDEQVLHLLKILQMPSCNIWCLNIGETYNVTTRTWKLFAKGLKRTKITHMYASEHTISTKLKDEIRDTIRKNRSKHDMHINPDNLDVIVQCTHCWWNPVNAKVLRPYLSKRGLDYILKDKEAQGLRGSLSEAPGTGETS